MKNNLLILIMLLVSTTISLAQSSETMQKSAQHKAVTKAFFTALEAKELDQLVALFAPDAEHINPYASGLFPTGAKGKEEIRKYWAPVFENFGAMEFPIEQLYAMDDGQTVFVKFKGKIELKDQAGFYENDYYATFTFNKEGLIEEYVEIFNPIVAARGFGLLDNIK